MENEKLAVIQATEKAGLDKEKIEELLKDSSSYWYVPLDADLYDVGFTLTGEGNDFIYKQFPEDVLKMFQYHPQDVESKSYKELADDFDLREYAKWHLDNSDFIRTDYGWIMFI